MGMDSNQFIFADFQFESRSVTDFRSKNLLRFGHNEEVSCHPQDRPDQHRQQESIAVINDGSLSLT